MPKHRHHDFWLSLNLKTVIVEGMECKIRSGLRRITYPYERTKLDVIADPIDKTNPKYREVKFRLGDDWHYDVFELSDVEFAGMMKRLNQKHGV